MTNQEAIDQLKVGKSWLDASHAFPETCKAIDHAIAVLEVQKETEIAQDDPMLNDWLSPVESERKVQIEQIRKLWPNFESNCPNWQTMNGLIHYALIGAKIIREAQP